MLSMLASNGSEQAHSVAARMLASVFLDDSWELHEKRADTARTTLVFNVDVNPTANGTYGVLGTDTVKLVESHRRNLGHTSGILP